MCRCKSAECVGVCGSVCESVKCVGLYVVCIRVCEVCGVCQSVWGWS